MEKSGFQLVKQRLLSLDYSVNEKAEAKAGNLNITANTKVDKSGENSAKVTFSFYIFKNEPIEDVPFKISIVMEGDFKWNKEFAPEIIDTLLNSNGPAILLSYMRSIISQLTVLSGFPALVIPLLNFTKKK